MAVGDALFARFSLDFQQSSCLAPCQLQGVIVNWIFFSVKTQCLYYIVQHSQNSHKKKVESLIPHPFHFPSPFFPLVPG